MNNNNDFIYLSLLEFLDNILVHLSVKEFGIDWPYICPILVKNKYRPSIHPIR